MLVGKDLCVFQPRRARSNDLCLFNFLSCMLWKYCGQHTKKTSPHKAKCLGEMLGDPSVKLRVRCWTLVPFSTSSRYLLSDMLHVLIIYECCFCHESYLSIALLIIKVGNRMVATITVCLFL